MRRIKRGNMMSVCLKNIRRVLPGQMMVVMWFVWGGWLYAGCCHRTGTALCLILGPELRNIPPPLSLFVSLSLSPPCLHSRLPGRTPTLLRKVSSSNDEKKKKKKKKQTLYDLYNKQHIHFLFISWLKRVKQESTPARAPYFPLSADFRLFVYLFQP